MIQAKPRTKLLQPSDNKQQHAQAFIIFFLPPLAPFMLHQCSQHN